MLEAEYYSTSHLCLSIIQCYDSSYVATVYKYDQCSASFFELTKIS